MTVKQLVMTAFLLLLLAIPILPQTTDAKSQAASPNLLEKIDLKFNLTGTPTPDDIGFDDRKGFWKLRYELLLSDAKTIDDLISKAYVKCKNTTAGYQKCVGKVNKKLDKKFKKIALFVSRGAFVKNSLFSQAEREIFVPVNFSPDVIHIFNDAAQSAVNPVFLLQIKSNVSAKTSTKKKIRYKTATTFQYTLKLVRRDGSFDFFNITVFGASIGIEKQSNGGISYSIYRN